MPLVVEGVLEAAQVGGRHVHVRLLHLDQVQADDRIQLDIQHLRALAHDLAVHLAGWRHIDHRIAQQPGRAAQPATRVEHAAALFPGLLGGAFAAQVAGGGRHPVLGETAFAQVDLATAAEATAAAHRVDIDPQRPGGFQQRSAQGKAAAVAGRGEYDKCILGYGHGVFLDYSGEDEQQPRFGAAA
ncbi:hypothetical protein D3C86_1695410 [compost metagenome]